MVSLKIVDDMARDAVVERLAIVLYEELERLDPSESPSWTGLEENERDVWRFCISRLALEHGDWIALR